MRPEDSTLKLVSTRGGCFRLESRGPRRRMGRNATGESGIVTMIGRGPTSRSLTARRRTNMRTAIASVWVFLLVGFGCVPSKSAAQIVVTRGKYQIVLNREGRRLGFIVDPYFYGGEGATNFIDMSHQEKLTTINLLREKAGAVSKLLFFEINLSREFTPVDSSDGIDSQLRSCALTPDEIARVKEAVIVAVDPHQMPKEWKPAPKPGEKGRWGHSGGDVVVNSSKYDVNYLTHYTYDNTGAKEAYRAACCLILSPTVQR